MNDTQNEALLAKAEAWLQAGRDYWKAANELGVLQGAVVWVRDTDGALFVFTRGEYESVITNAIVGLPKQDTTHYFQIGEPE